jgi:hypothetical protein
MDPNANLKEQAEYLAWLAGWPHDREHRVGHIDLRDRRETRARLSQLRADLTDWLNAGGFAPDWTRYPAAARYYRHGDHGCGHPRYVGQTFMDCPTCIRLQAQQDRDDDERDKAAQRANA